MRAYERLLNYVKVYTTSDPVSDTHPTTARQFDLARMLVKERNPKDSQYMSVLFKVCGNLERIGDLAVNIAKRALSFYSIPTAEMPVNLRPLCECTKNALGKSLDALIRLDADLAAAGLAYDDVIDEMNRENHAKLLGLMHQHPENVERYLNLLNVSRHLERIGDYATNIDEDVIYMVNGAIVRHRTGIDGEFKKKRK